MAGLALVDEFAGVFDLLRRQFALASEFHAPALCGFHSGARSVIRLRSYSRKADDFLHGFVRLLCRRVL
jgi:hypothetical protein